VIIRAVAFAADSIKLSGQLYLPAGGEGKPHPTVCICHGIPHSSDNKPDPDDGGYPALAELICREGFAVLIFRFRGVGDSGGNFDIKGWTRDLKAAIDYLWLLPEVQQSRIALLGFSGGAAVSVCVAACEPRVSSLVACACPADFDAIEEALASGGSVLEHFRSIGVIRDSDFPSSEREWRDGFARVRPIDHISGIAPRPLLLVHGSEDDVVDVEHARRLYDEAGEPRELIVIDGAGHRLRRDERSIRVVTDWLKSRAA